MWCLRLNISHDSFHTYSYLARAPVLSTEMCWLFHSLERSTACLHTPLSILQTETEKHTHTHTRCRHTHIPEDSHMGIRWQKRLIAINVHSSVRTSVKWTLWLKALSKWQPRRAGVERTRWEGPPLSQAWQQKNHVEERPVLGRWRGSPH